MRLINTLIAFLAGIIGFGILFLVFEFIIRITGLNALGSLPLLSAHLTESLFNGLSEELGKFLSIKSWKIENPYSISFGLGWSGIESFTRHLARGDVHSLSVRISPTILQIITAMIICYFIKRKRPVLGLIAAIVIHTGYDFLLTTPGQN